MTGQGLSRRQFGQGLAGIVVAFSLAPELLRPAEAGLPGDLGAAPMLDAWLRIDPDGQVTVFTGKVELGQGILTAFAQVAAEELDVPLYDFPSHKIVRHLVPEMPLRTSALRSLGAYGNVFAVESFMDELAAAAGTDPVGFRLRHLKDPRARAVYRDGRGEGRLAARLPVRRPARPRFRLCALQEQRLLRGLRRRGRRRPQYGAS